MIGIWRISEGGREMLWGKQGELNLGLLTCLFEYREESTSLVDDAGFGLPTSGLLDLLDHK